MSNRRFSPGFRLSGIDVVVILVATALAVTGGLNNYFVGGLVAFVFCHFFLFCNVFRVSRPLELVWAAIFLTLCICTVRFAFPGWPVTFLVALAVTLGVVFIEMRKPSYHGIMWQRINPRLREWWEANAKE